MVQEMHIIADITMQCDFLPYILSNIKKINDKKRMKVINKGLHKKLHKNKSEWDYIVTWQNWPDVLTSQ